MSQYRGWISLFALFLGIASSHAQVLEPQRVPERPPIPETAIARRPNPVSAAIGVAAPAGFGSLQARPLTFPSGVAGTTTTFVVTTTEDTGNGSLRTAIDDANSAPGADIITFALTGSRVVISPRSPLPIITDQLTIDGTTAPGYFTSPTIQIDGAQAGASFGLNVDAAGCTIRGLSITRFSNSGIVLLGGSTTIEACYVGVEPDGSTAGGNGVDGITVYSASNRIGRPGTRPNVISANGRSGVAIDGSTASGNTVQNCYAGTNAAANSALPNFRWGVEVVNATDAMIGGLTADARNILSGNGNAGVGVRGTNANRVKVQGNYVGVGINPAVAIPNQNHGVEIAPAPERATPGAPSNVLVGGVWNSPEGNLISGNRGSGVALFLATDGGAGLVVAGNIIGLDGGKSIAVPNQFGISIRHDNATGAMPGARIGGLRVDSANVVAGNTWSGMYLMGAGARNNTVRGNYVGVVPLTGNAYLPVPNVEAGIVLDEAGGNVIGGPDTLSGNVICANGYGGMQIYGDNAAGTMIINNYIGTAPGRPRTLGNGQNGIYVSAPGITIGRIKPDYTTDGNIIAWNAYAGIYVSSGQGNSLRGNRLYGNGTMGIDLGSAGLTPNDTTDGDTGANTLLNYPIIESATRHWGSTDVTFRILGEPYKEYTVDFYANDTLGALLFGEGKDFMGEVKVTTDLYGTWSGNATFTWGLDSWEHVTAMATDADGNSSEFCRAFCLTDADGDGLMDCWEKPGIGIDLDMNGLVDLDLYARGANWDHKDLFVEVDRMEGSEFVYPARDMAVAFFRTAPDKIIGNPDHRDGVSLHIEYTYLDTIPKAPWPASPWVEFQAAKRAHFGTSLEREHPNHDVLLQAKKLAYRYCIFADRYGTKGSSGLAEAIWGNDFIVTLGNWNPVGGTVEEQAGTFVHELGHTLGLRHGGGDDINWKPNYISVMNYFWQFPNAKAMLNNELTWRIVFSPTALSPLNESNLNEKKGLDVPEGVYPGIIFVHGNKASGFARGVLAPGASVDWNNDLDSSSTNGVIEDINGVDENSPGEVLWGHADWPSIKYGFRESPTFPDPLPGMMPAPLPAEFMAEEDEMTFTMRDSLAIRLPPYGFLPPERTPYFHPRDTSTVGGNFGGIPLFISIPAPVGGLKYYFKSSTPDLMTVDRVITLFQGNSEATVGFVTRGVERDTTAFILSDSLEMQLVASVRIRAARLHRLNARTDSGCVITELGGFRKRYLAGCTILFEAELDGETPAGGGVVQISSSRPDLLNPPAVVPIGGFARSQLFSVRAAAAVSAPQFVILTATYRDSSRNDTVIIMPAPQYTLTQIGSGGSSTPELKINNAGQVLVNRGAFVKDGVYTWLSSLPGFRLWNILGINDLGWVCGSVHDSGTINEKPAYWRPDTTIVLPTLDAANPSSLVNAMNNQGEMVGVAIASAYPYFQKPVIWRNGAISEMERYEEFWLNPRAINDASQVIATGYYSSSRPYANLRNAFRWDGGTLTRIQRPDYANLFVEGIDIAANGTALLSAPPLYWLHDGAFSPAMSPPAPFVKMTAYDMNDSLDVVGSMAREGTLPDEYISFPFVRRGGYQYDLTCLVTFSPNWTNFTAAGINNSGTIVGYAWDKVASRYRLFMLTPAGPNSVEEPRRIEEIPTEYQLFQNYPNPFNPMTVIRYGLPQAADVQLEVYTVLGQRVRMLVDGRQAAGRYEVDFNGSSLASGVYLYRLRAGGFTQIRKMILMK